MSPTRAKHDADRNVKRIDRDTWPVGGSFTVFAIRLLHRVKASSFMVVPLGSGRLSVVRGKGNLAVAPFGKAGSILLKKTLIFLKI